MTVTPRRARWPRPAGWRRWAAPLGLRTRAARSPKPVIPGSRARRSRHERKAGRLAGLSPGGRGPAPGRAAGRPGALVWPGPHQRDPGRQPGGGHDPGHHRRRGARRPADRVQRPRRAARVEHVLLESGRGDQRGLGRGRGGVLRTARGLDHQPAHGRGRVPRRLGRRDLLPAVADLLGRHPADPHRPVGGAGLPGRPVQHRRRRAVGRRRDRGYLPRFRGQPAARHPRHRLPDRRVHRRRGDRLAGRRAQGQDRGARGDRHDHAQLHHVQPAVLPARHADRAAAARAVQPDQPADRGQRRAVARGRPAAAGRPGLPGRAGGRVRDVVAAHPVDDRVPVPHRGRQRGRGPQRRHERGAHLGRRDAGGRRPGRPGRRRGDPRPAAPDHLQQLRYLRLRRHHGRAARPGHPARRGACRAAVRRAARGRHQHGGGHAGALRRGPGAAGPDRAVRRGPAADQGDVPAAPDPRRRPDRVEGVERMTALVAPPALALPVSATRRYIAAGSFILFGLIDILLFGLFAKPGDATFVFTAGGTAHVPELPLPASTVCYVLGAASILIGVARAVVDPGKVWRRVSIGVVLVFFVISLLCWAYAGSAIPLNVVNLLQSTMNLSIPLVLGALAGCMCERSGVINIAIEGQLLLGAFSAAVVASAVGGLWLGLITGSLAGGLLGLVLAWFAIAYLVDQIILGVVLNVLASGLTGYLNDRVLVPTPDLNTGNTFSAIKIPVLGDSPIIGPIL